MSVSLKVFINGKFLCQEATGVQKYALGVTKALQKKHPEIIVIAPAGKYDHHGLNVKKTAWGCGIFWEQVWLPLFSIFHGYDLLINFCNTAPFLVRKQIVTIHDLAFLQNEEWFSPAFRRWYRFLIPGLSKRSLEIITVSEVIKKEIGDAFFIPPAKIKVIPNGIPEMEYDKQKPFSFRYLFLTGIYNPRKNASFVPKQLQDIKKREYHIVGVGVDARIYGRTDCMQDENLHLLEYVDNKQYYSLMKHADALVFPSGYEGFGIPVLEALVLGTMAIVPDIDVYRESFGNLPVYYLPGDESSFLDALDIMGKHRVATKDVEELKNKFNFDRSAEMLSGTFQRYQVQTEI